MVHFNLEISWKLRDFQLQEFRPDFALNQAKEVQLMDQRQYYRYKGRDCFYRSWDTNFGRHIEWRNMGYELNAEVSARYAHKYIIWPGISE